MKVNDYVIVLNLHNAVGKILQFLDYDHVLVKVNDDVFNLHTSELGRVVQSVI